MRCRYQADAELRPPSRGRAGPGRNFPIGGAYGGGGVVDFHIELVALVIAMWTQRELGAVAIAIDKVPRKVVVVEARRHGAEVEPSARTRARRHMDGLYKGAVDERTPQAVEPSRRCAR